MDGESKIRFYSRKTRVFKGVENWYLDFWPTHDEIMRIAFFTHKKALEAAIQLEEEREVDDEDQPAL